MTAVARDAIVATAAPVDAAQIHVVTKAELADRHRQLPWEDPDGIARPTAGKLRAIQRNPLSDCSDDPAQLIGTHGGRVVGRVDVLPGRIDVDGAAVPCLSASGLYVAPAYRHLGMGALLLLRLQQLHHTIVACGVSQQAYPLYEKLRWRDLPMRRHVFVRRSKPILDRYFPAWAATPGRILADGALAVIAAATAIPARRRLRHLSCDEVPSCPPDMEELLGRSAGPAAFHRSAAWIDWILHNSFESHPRDRRGLFVVRTRSGAPAAYFVVTSRFHESASQLRLPQLLLGSLQDWMIFEPEVIDEEGLVLLARQTLLQWGVDAVEVCLGAGDHIDGMWRRGFRHVGDLHLLLKAGPGSPLRDRAVVKDSGWRLRPADGDNAL